MGLIERIKTALGLDSKRQGSQSSRSDESAAQDVGVTVEREPDTTTEDAVKGTDNGADAEAATEATEDDATEADDETTAQSTVESEPSAVESEPAAETSETTSEPETDGTEDVQSIKGIGPAYAERLADAEVETVGDLAAADAETIAEQTGIAESRVATWIEQAGE